MDDDIGKREKQVNRELNLLDKRVRNLSENLINLISILESVISLKVDSSEKEKLVDPTEELCPLANSIRGIRFISELDDNKIEDLISRLEI